MVSSGDVLRCLIVDDNAEFLHAASRLLQRDGMAIIGVASTGAVARRRCGELRPDVILVDVDLGAESGFEVAEQLHRDGLPNPPPVIMISSHAERDMTDMMEGSTAVGFVSKLSLSAVAIREVLATGDPSTPTGMVIEPPGR
jgi:CheY-like chemotaxis protein